VHPTDHSTVETIELARHAAKLGADAVMIWVPFEWAKTQDMMADFYEHVCAQIPLPVFAYNKPHSGRLMSGPTLDRVANVPNVCALKNAVASFTTSAALQRALGDRLVVSDPLEENYPLAITQVDQQVLLGTTSVYLMQSASWRPIADYAEAFRRGDTDEGWRRYHRLDEIRLFWRRMYGVLWDDTGALHPLAKLKVWMDAIGMRGGPMRPPLHNLGDEERKAFVDELRNTPPMKELYPNL
jgi:4-hydroxy-tetrahydrodipicolinate synthase